MEEYADLPECRPFRPYVRHHLVDKSLLHRRVKKELHTVFAELRSEKCSHLNYFWAQIREMRKQKGEEKIYRERYVGEWSA